jgi:ABC-type glycerol-3-phosphate transport system permease component
MTGLEPTIARHAPAAAPAAVPSPAHDAPQSRAASRRKPSRLLRYLATRAWVHATLLFFVAIFLFPFVYMFATSMKTDEELIDRTYFPSIPTFQPISPRVRKMPAVERPPEAPADAWDAALPELLKITRAAVDAAAAAAKSAPVGADTVSPEAHRAAATNFLLHRLIPRLGPDAWTGPRDALFAQYRQGLTETLVADALLDRLARLELRGLQVRSLDAHIYPVSLGPDIAAKWAIESGDAALIPTAKDSSVLRYRFDTPGAAPIVLRCDFPFPTAPANFHKLILALKPDDSWHKVDATLDLAGVHWVSQKTKYLGTTRRQTILFQPPTFDDTTDRKKIWVPLKREGKTSSVEPAQRDNLKLQAPNNQVQIASVEPAQPDNRKPQIASSLPATLRLTITPSSTPAAIWGKAKRNYDRAFESVPFWRYVRNSLFVVILATLGTLFSASFVAYAFARLNWPGRTLAFGILLSTMMLPPQVTFIPQFMVWKTAGLYNTLSPLWLPAWFGTAFFIFLMTQHMKTIPRELEEAARIDGCSALRTWWSIILPQCKPALAAIAILVSMSAWNDFLSPLIYLRDQQKFPLSLGLYALRLDTPEGGTDWTLVMAGNVLMTFPVVVIFFLFQRYFISGMTMSAVKA